MVTVPWGSPPQIDTEAYEESITMFKNFGQLVETCIPSRLALKRHEGNGTVLLILVPSLPRTTTAKWGATSPETFCSGSLWPANINSPESRVAGICSAVVETRWRWTSINIVLLMADHPVVIEAGNMLAFLIG